MNTTKHTPGPWCIEQGGLPNVAIVGTFCLEKIQVCGKVANAADANLIAAAPGLLAALEALVADPFHGPTAKQWRDARNAIAQATETTKEQA